ncbi:hypothetical protein ABNX05_10830 [Lysinibacillus sp. M3]|uniref:Uncharacterized protein n=1 Tax=Lysinibacillus zambalensis TaxID=3160866 RepID=A0ABV1MRI5_9BACI
MTVEKFKVEISGVSNITININDKHKLKLSPMVDISSIIIDYRLPMTSRTCTSNICLLGNYRSNNGMYTNILDIDNFSSNELAKLILTMIKLYRPKEIRLDATGVGMTLKDALLGELLQENIILNDDGSLVYKEDNSAVKLIKIHENETLINNSDVEKFIKNTSQTAKAIEEALSSVWKACFESNNNEKNEMSHVLSAKVKGENIYFVTVSDKVPYVVKNKFFDAIKDGLCTNTNVLMLPDEFKLEIMDSDGMLQIKHSLNIPRTFREEVLRKVKYAFDNKHNLIMIPDSFKLEQLNVK